jgi:hypothetical protein
MLNHLELEVVEQDRQSGDSPQDLYVRDHPVPTAGAILTNPFSRQAHCAP